MEATRTCIAINCRNSVVARDLCQTHYARWKRHQHIEQTRPQDWGKREKHPLYGVWGYLKRFRKEVTCAEWLEDFWAFANTVGDRPKDSGKVTLERVIETEKLGPGNWRWAVPKGTAEWRGNKAEYMREYNHARRLADPQYHKNSELKRHYGITREEYEELLAKQLDLCAICKQPELLQIKGKVVLLAVDHCHTTNKIRGLLCSNCNRGIGHLKHDVNILQSAISYLKETGH